MAISGPMVGALHLSTGLFRIRGDSSSGDEVAGQAFCKGCQGSAETSGKNESVALRGLHDHPVISGYILEDHMRPSRTEAPVLSE